MIYKTKKSKDFSYVEIRKKYVEKREKVLYKEKKGNFLYNKKRLIYKTRRKSKDFLYVESGCVKEKSIYVKKE